MSQSGIAALQTQYIGGHDVCAVQNHQAVYGAHESVRAAAPAHYFGNRQLFHRLIDDVFEQFGERLACLGELVGVYVLLAVVDDFQAADVGAEGAGEAFERFGGRTVFHRVGDGWAFFDNVLVILHGFDV